VQVRIGSVRRRTLPYRGGMRLELRLESFTPTRTPVVDPVPEADGLRRTEALRVSQYRVSLT